MNFWICEHPPVFYPGPERSKQPPVAPGDIPVVPTNRGASHLPWARPGAPIPDRPRQRGLLSSANMRTASRRPRSARWHTLALRATARPRHPALCAAGRPTQPRPDRAAPPEGAQCARLLRPRQDRRWPLKVSRHCTYHGVAPERGDGSGTLLPYQPLWLRRFARLIFLQSGPPLGRGCGRAGQTARHPALRPDPPPAMSNPDVVREAQSTARLQPVWSNKRLPPSFAHPHQGRVQGRGAESPSGSRQGRLRPPHASTRSSRSLPRTIQQPVQR